MFSYTVNVTGIEKQVFTVVILFFIQGKENFLQLDIFLVHISNFFKYYLFL